MWRPIPGGRGGAGLSPAGSPSLSLCFQNVERLLENIGIKVRGLGSGCGCWDSGGWGRRVARTQAAATALPLCPSLPQTSALREMVETWHSSSSGFLPGPEQRGPKGDPGEQGPPGKQVRAGCSVGAGGWGAGPHGHQHSLFPPPGPHGLLRRPRAEGRPWRPRPSGAARPGPRGEGRPGTSWPGRGAWEAWHSWAPGLGWERRGDRKARRTGKPGGCREPGKGGQELDSPQTYPTPLCTLGRAGREGRPRRTGELGRASGRGSQEAWQGSHPLSFLQGRAGPPGPPGPPGLPGDKVPAPAPP